MMKGTGVRTLLGVLLLLGLVLSAVRLGASAASALVAVPSVPPSSPGSAARVEASDVGAPAAEAAAPTAGEQGTALTFILVAAEDGDGDGDGADGLRDGPDPGSRP
jgi:hypothetical protein